MNKNAEDLIYLLSCAVNGITPDAVRVQAMNPEQLFRLAKTHSLCGAAYIALRHAGTDDRRFSQAYFMAVRKLILLDAARREIFADFERRGIWYMPLKGVILRALYPENGMREMADNDVLFDAGKQAEVREIMRALGYTEEGSGKSNHDVYMKPPVLNFEMHKSLFKQSSAFYSYYQDPERLMRPDGDSRFGRCFSDEDFYVYMLAHEYKHFSSGGTGLRSLLDCYVFCKSKGDALDWDYIGAQCRQLGIADFEQEQRALAEKVFSAEKHPELTAREQELLSYFLTSGTYGTLTRAGENKVERGFAESGSRSRAGYILRRLFPDFQHMQTWYPFFAKHRLLLPAGYLWRLIRAPFAKKNTIKSEMKALRKHDNTKVSDRG